jgi:hypothetical protein
MDLLAALVNGYSLCTGLGYALVPSDYALLA